jgi:hypothetical protein
MGRCLEGKSEVSFQKTTHKCGKCGARTADRAHVCQPEPIMPPPQSDPEKTAP